MLGHGSAVLDIGLQITIVSFVYVVVLLIGETLSIMW